MIQPAIVQRSWVESYREWAKGRSQYLTFLIRVEDWKVVNRIVRTQNELSTFPCVDPFPKEYLHITVKGCGFLARSESHKDDILTENIGRIVTQAQDILRTHTRFDVRLSKLNIFDEVVLVEVHDMGRVGKMNRSLQSIKEVKKMKYDHPELLPHISIAQFRKREGFSKLIDHLETLRETEFGKFTVSQVDLVSAQLSGKYPILETLQTFNLR